jgi:succinate dehydrogenase/fumarate reductase-like Fe-S protein
MLNCMVCEFADLQIDLQAKAGQILGKEQVLRDMTNERRHLAETLEAAEAALVANAARLNDAKHGWAEHEAALKKTADVCTTCACLSTVCASTPPVLIWPLCMLPCSVLFCSRPARMVLMLLPCWCILR